LHSQTLFFAEQQATHDNFIIGIRREEHAFAWKMIQSPLISFVAPESKELQP
jgi:hypothetical protein